MRPQCYPFCKLQVTPSSPFHLFLPPLVSQAKSQQVTRPIPPISGVQYQLPNCNWKSLWYPRGPTPPLWLAS